MKKVDAIILGQGLAGTCLSLEMARRGLSVVLFDPRTHSHNGLNNASRSAAGLFNPITGRKMVKTWMADHLFKDLSTFYQGLERAWSAQFFHEIPIYRPFHSIEDQNDWVGADRDPEYQGIVEKVFTQSVGLSHIDDPFGGLLLKNSGYLDIPTFLDIAYERLCEQIEIIDLSFDYHKLKIGGEFANYADGSNKYLTKWVIDCTGVSASQSLYWSDMRFKPVKGEWLSMELEFDSNYIVNRGVFMIPRDGQVRVGATYDHSSLNLVPSEKGKNELLQRMAKIYRGEYRILGQRAGVRPATYDRKPFVGIHPTYQSLVMLNGLGAKGVTLAPFFAKHLTDHLLDDKPLLSAIDVKRCF